MMAKDYSISDITQDPRTDPGRAREAPGGRGTPGPACPRTCPTAARAGGRLLAPQSSESPALCPGLLRQPPGREGRGRPPAAATCGTGLAARELNGQDRAGPPSESGGGTCRAEGYSGHRGDDCSASCVSEGQSVLRPRAGTSGPPDPCARPPPRKDHAAEAQSSRRPARLLLTGPARLLRRFRSPQPPRLPALTDAQRKVPGMLPAPPQQPPGGGREPAQGNLGVVVLVPLHLHPWPLSISRLVESSVSPCFPCLPQGFTSAPGLINVGAPQPSPGYPLLTLDQWFSKYGTQTYSFDII